MYREKILGKCPLNIKTQMLKFICKILSNKLKFKKKSDQKLMSFNNTNMSILHYNYIILALKNCVRKMNKA